VLVVGYREDYYKFAHCLMPNSVFNYGRLLVYKILRNEEVFINNLKITWSKIEVENNQYRNIPPEFELDIKNLNDEHTAIIITMPEAKENQEALYIGITYDKDDNFRYFTYEIGKGSEGAALYFLYEWTLGGKHINYGAHHDMQKNLFIKEISSLLLYDLL
jgi:hypothetical protein